MKYLVDKKIRYFDSEKGKVIEHVKGDIIDYTQPTWEMLGLVKVIEEEKKVVEEIKPVEIKKKPFIKKKKSKK